MKLYVMRHGPAEDQAASGIDEDRALSTPGRERVRAVAKILTAEGEEPAQVVTSPLVRAVQTAEIVAIATKLSDRGGTVTVLRDLAPGGEAETLAWRMASEGQKRVMFVGHEPDLSQLAAALLGTFERPFDKATVVAIHLSPGEPRGRLRFVLDPKALRLDPDARDAP
jgi:phosphohistidine phosphatase